MLGVPRVMQEPPAPDDDWAWWLLWAVIAAMAMFPGRWPARCR